MKKVCKICQEFFEERSLVKKEKQLYYIGCLKKENERKTMKTLREVDI
jgi:hypothetical protein